MPDISVLVDTTVFNTKISEIEKKIPDTSSLVTTNVWMQKSVKLWIKFQIILNILLVKNLIT